MWVDRPLTAFPRPPGCLREPTSKGREGKGQESKRGVRGRGRGKTGNGEWKGRGRSARERGGKGKGKGREVEGEEEGGGERRKVRTPLRQFLLTPLIVVIVGVEP